MPKGHIRLIDTTKELEASCFLAGCFRQGVLLFSCYCDLPQAVSPDGGADEKIVCNGEPTELLAAPKEPGSAVREKPRILLLMVPHGATRGALLLT